MKQLACRVETAGRLMGAGSRSTAHRWAERGLIPTVGHGRLRRVPLGLLAEQLGVGLEDLAALAAELERRADSP